MGVTGEPARARIEVELVLGSDPIRGELREPGGSRKGFVGWLELIGALERIRGPQAPAWEGEGPDRHGSER